MKSGDMHVLWQTAHMQGANLSYVEELYEAYLINPDAISEEWRQYFDDLPTERAGDQPEASVSLLNHRFKEIGRRRGNGASGADCGQDIAHEQKQVKVLQLINAYRVRGHQKANIDPLGLMQREHLPDLDIEFHQLNTNDLPIEFNLGSLFFGPDKAPLSEILRDLERTYCSNIGYEYMHIVDTRQKRWFQQRIEPVRGCSKYSDEAKGELLEALTAAEGLEKYLAARYPGTKRFGLEGGESLIPMIGELIMRAGAFGAKEVVIGMAHRGRLNVLVNILGKNPADLFEEFEGKVEVTNGSGDVKYHQGFSSNWHTPHGEVHLALAFNPSHLEIVSPVVEGSVRARQDRRADDDANQVVPIIVHGDAAFAGQGVVMEVFQMSQTRAYKTGGTIHIVLNNQVGFTTSRADDARSTEYCTDVAKMVQAPILHVNGDDPEAVLFVTQLAMDYRDEFKRDVVIDLVCYRRRGHNEADEPSSTQPLMYRAIKKHPSTRELYANRLISEGAASETKCQELENIYRSHLDAGTNVVSFLVKEPNFALFEDWTPYLNKTWTAAGDTSIDLDRLQALGKSINSIPDDFKLQRQVAKIYDDRSARWPAGALPRSTGVCAETLAYATLLEEGYYNVRMTGQDVGRGTFSHRHVVAAQPGRTVLQLYAHASICAEGAGPDMTICTIHYLSEEAVLAFEYGYATTAPQWTLVIWEAQFGDFANGAQVVIDQFITSGEHKWGRLVWPDHAVLPHGYEGQGPEHSSARLERFLQLCAEHNFQVCIPTTPTQVFHMLRRQVLRPLRKPLIVMTAKSLLRHKKVVSTIEELADGSFKTVLPETGDLDNDRVTRAILCSGKIYYDLLHKRDEEGRRDLAILRLEQLYPFPEDDLSEALAVYPSLGEVTWVQEEPLNQGAWYSSQHHMRRTIARHKNYITLSQVSRPPSASPAAGSMGLHVIQQQKVVDDAINL